MSEPRNRSIRVRVVKFLLGNDEPHFVAAASGAIIALSNLIAFHVVHFSAQPTPPIWQMIGAETALGLFLIPGFS